MTLNDLFVKCYYVTGIFGSSKLAILSNIYGGACKCYSIFSLLPFIRSGDYVDFL